jgi:L-lactate dehydrogenase complex protein LldF
VKYGAGLRQSAGRSIAAGSRGKHLPWAADQLAARKDAAANRLHNFDELRSGARRARQDAIRCLPELLEQLADAVEANGGHVFFAADGGEACSHIVGLARDRGATRVVKSKSMVTEEIGLNRALEGAGLQVTETDLGEWIVQLAGETPSHIVAPAIHLTRGQVAALFEEVGGTPLSDDPEDLCAFARERLRSEFLAADIGISGCNFAVADTGTVCLVTNEGNGRMVTSVPRIHVAVMGMERVVATWEELDLFLALLPRSATGQQLSAYTTLCSGPRQPGEVDGPDEFHLVIVDNGRSGLLGTPFQEMLDCIRCGSCLNVCPVYRQIGGHAYNAVYSGPMGAVLTPLLDRATDCELSQASTLCGACYQACPVMIPLQDLLLALRRDAAPAFGRRERLLWHAWARLWGNPLAYRMTTRLGAMAATLVPGRLLSRRWAIGRDLPRPDPGPGLRKRLHSGES